MTTGLRRIDLTGIYQLLNIRVVRGELTERAVGDAVGPRVADVGDQPSGHPVVGCHDQGDDRGAHVDRLSTDRRALQEFVDLLEFVGHCVHFRRDICDQAGQTLDGQCAGYLACIVPSHSVGHREHRWLRQYRVLVEDTDPADFGRDPPLEDDTSELRFHSSISLIGQADDMSGTTITPLGRVASPHPDNDLSKMGTNPPADWPERLPELPPRCNPRTQQRTHLELTDLRRIRRQQGRRSDWPPSPPPAGPG